MEPKEGLRLRLLAKLKDPFNPYPAGEEGTILSVNDMGHIYVHWDNGNELSVIPGTDHYEIFSPQKPLLDFTGMTDEQIETFIVNTQLTYEVDAQVATFIMGDGFMYENQVDELEATGWLNGQILGLDVANNIGLSVDDAYIEALKRFKQVQYDLEMAAELFELGYGPLI